ADAALAGIVPTAANQQRLSFSTPYLRRPAKFLIGRARRAEVGVVAGSVHEAMGRALFADRTWLTFASVAELEAALLSAKVGSAFGDGLSLGLWASSPAASKCCVVAAGAYYLPQLRADALTIAVARQRDDLRLTLDAALRDIQTSGELNDILRRHVPFDLFE
ncbi:MAG: transporter substrate-binding domain-containing protein, partial [Phyllobacteriaceae bacterium]|nr:transporter substrate-binding domain-containing protein [Phyllobacteriaceae bacterium]